MKRILRTAHRWLGLLMVVQLVAWMASGLYFSLFPITEIRGEHLTRAAEEPSAEMLAATGSPAPVQAALDRHLDTGWSLSSLELVVWDGRPSWRVAGTTSGQSFRRLVTPQGEVQAMLDASAAKRTAAGWLLEPAEPVSSEWVEPGSNPDLRGRDSAAWKVSFEGPEPVDLFVDPWTGELIARRTARWRLFDFLWMLHIMDYADRENFNHPLLQAAAALGLLVALSGLVYWLLTRRPYRRRRAAGAA